jgi:hypothetical protein
VGFQIVQKILQSRHQISGRNLTTLIVLAQRADDSTGQCWPSRENISRQARQSPRTTTRAIHALAETGILIIQERKSGCRSNLYTIDVTLVECEPKPAYPQIPPSFSQTGPSYSQNLPSFPQNTQKPASHLWEKRQASETTGANVGTLNNQLSKNKVKTEVETRAAATGCKSRLSRFPLPDLTGLLGRLSMASHCRPRSRAPDPTLPPIPLTTTPRTLA